MAERPPAILVTREVFTRMAEYLQPMLPGLCDAFIAGIDLGPAQESLTTVMLPALRSAAQTRARSTQGRGLILMDQRKGGAIWYLDQATARVSFGALPVTLWRPIDQLLARYHPHTEVVVIRLAGRLMEVLYFDHDDMLNMLGDGPLRIPALPQPLVQEQGPAFSLPPDVTSRREDGPQGMAYIFTHARLGELGRMLLTDRGPGQMQMTHVVAGSPADPMTAERQALLTPIVQGLSRHLEMSMGHPDPGLDAGTPLPPGTAPMLFPVADPVPIATTVHPCAQCGRDLVFLIFGDDPSLTLEDYARKMFDTIREKNLTTFVLGPAQGGAELDINERPSALLEVWPVRKPVRQIKPPAFDAILARLSAKHCKNKRRAAGAADRPATATPQRQHDRARGDAGSAGQGLYGNSKRQPTLQRPVGTGDSIPYQEQHAAARAAIRRQIEAQTMPVEVLVDALLMPAHPDLRQEAAWAFQQVGRGIIFIDYLPLLRDQDQVTGFVAAADLAMFKQLGDAFHQAVVAAVAAYDPASQYVTAVVMPHYPPQVITWPQDSAVNALAARLNAAADEDDAEPPEVQWQSLEMLPTFAFMLDDLVESTEDQFVNFTQAKARPGSMDDATILRAERVYTEQRAYLDRYAQQFVRWQVERLTPAQQREITRLIGVAQRMITVTDQIVELIAAIKPHTIEAIMDKRDVGLGLEALRGQQPPRRKRRS